MDKRTFITEKEFNTLLKAIPDRRWRLLFKILWDTGIRISEALALERKDLKNGRIGIWRLKRKSPVYDLVPLPKDTWRELVSITPKQGKVFPGFTRQQADYHIRMAGYRTGIKGVHCHLLRHSLGRRVARMNLGLPALEHLGVLKDMLGHASISSTLRYFKASPEDVQETWKKLHRRT